MREIQEQGQTIEQLTDDIETKEELLFLRNEQYDELQEAFQNTILENQEHEQPLSNSGAT